MNILELIRSTIILQREIKKLNIPYDFENDIEVILKYLVKEGWMYDGAGSDRQPYSENWCKSLEKGIGSNYKNGISIIDWGCGYGRFLNYMFKTLKNFTYYGFEIPSINNGDLLIDFNKKTYERYNDENKKINFGFIDDYELINSAINNCNTVILGSVFTHISLADSKNIILKFEQLLKKQNGCIVFSVILADKYELVGPGAYGDSSAYEYVTHTAKQINTLTFNKYKINKIVDFKTDHWAIHTILKLNYDS